MAATGAILAAVSNIGPLRKTEVQFLALNLAAAIVDSAGRALATLPGAAPVVRGELVCALLRLLAADGTPASVLVIALRTFCALFVCCPGLLKLQLEQFVAVCARVALDARGAPRPHAPLVLRALQALFQDPFFVAEVYANYDCDLYCANVLQQVAELLARAASLPSSGGSTVPSGSSSSSVTPVTSPSPGIGTSSETGSGSGAGSSVSSGSIARVNALAMDVLQTLLRSLKKCIAIVDSRSATAEGAAQTTTTATTKPGQQLTAAQTVRRIKLKKRVLGQAVEAFNRSAEEGLAFCAKEKIIASRESARDVAVFLHETPGLDKTRVGEFLCAKEAFSAAVLREYVRTQPRLGGAFGPALRDFMEGFVMEGDANVVGRMLEAFAAGYYERHGAGGTVFRSADACYVAAYSVVMLNVDLHNPALKQHMTQEQYIHNSRGINDGADLPRALLAALYADLKERAFALPEDYPSGRVTRRTCEDVLARTARVRPFVARAHLQDATAIALLRDAFATLWAPLIAALAAALAPAPARPPAVRARALAGYRLCADVAARYALTDVLDYLVASLCKAAALPLPLAGTAPAAAFGADRAAQRAAEAALRTAAAHARALRDAWPTLLAAVASFAACGLLEDGCFDVPSIPSDGGVEGCDGNEDGHDGEKGDGNGNESDGNNGKSSTTGGWLSSLWWGTSHAAREPSREEVLCEQRAKECVRRCDVRALVAACCTASDAAFPTILQALFACCENSGNSSNNSESDATTTTSPTVARRQERAAGFALDVLAACVVANKARLALVWRPVHAWLARAIAARGREEQPATNGGASCARLVAAYAALVYHIAGCPDARADLAPALWALAALPVRTLQRVGAPITAALHQLARHPAAVAALQHAGALAPAFNLLRALAPTAYGHRRGFFTLCALSGCPQAISSLSATASQQQERQEQKQEQEQPQQEEYTLTPDEFALCIGAVSHYSKLVFQVRVAGSSRPQQQRLYVTPCVELVHALFLRCTAWDACAQALGVLVELAHDPHPVARHLALSALQRLLLSAHLDRVTPPPAPAPAPALTTSSAIIAAASGAATEVSSSQSSSTSSTTSSSLEAASRGRLFAIVLRRVLLPLVGDYLKPLSGGADGVGESRVRACSLLVAFVLQHLRALCATDEFPGLLADTLRLLEQHHALAASTARTGAPPPPGTLVETLPELLKNVLFVFGTSDFFRRDDGSTGAQAWAAVARTAEKISPGLVQFVTTKLLPSVAPVTPEAPVEPSSSSSSSSASESVPVDAHSAPAESPGGQV